MKEYLLIPAIEAEALLKGTCDKTEQKILKDDKLSTNVILDVFNRLIKNKRLEDDIKLDEARYDVNYLKKDANPVSSVVENKERVTDEKNVDANLSSERKKRKEDMQSVHFQAKKMKRDENEIEDDMVEKSTKTESLGDYVERMIPSKYVQESINLVKDLIRNNVAKLDKKFKLKLNNANIAGENEVDLAVVLRAIFIKNASVMKHEAFLIELLKNVDEGKIRNNKLLALLKPAFGNSEKNNKVWFFR